MPTLFDFTKIITGNEDNRDNYSIVRIPQWPIKGMIEDEIQSDEQYRPDKVAYRVYNDASLSWIIDDANNWFHVKDYTIGRKFYRPSETTLVQMGIL